MKCLRLLKVRFYSIFDITCTSTNLFVLNTRKNTGSQANKQIRVIAQKYMKVHLSIDLYGRYV